MVESICKFCTSFCKFAIAKNQDNFDYFFNILCTCGTHFCEMMYFMPLLDVHFLKYDILPVQMTRCYIPTTKNHVIFRSKTNGGNIMRSENNGIHPKRRRGHFCGNSRRDIHRDVKQSQRFTRKKAPYFSHPSLANNKPQYLRTNLTKM